jgi:hypothetical protein
MGGVIVILGSNEVSDSKFSLHTQTTASKEQKRNRLCHFIANVFVCLIYYSRLRYTKSVKGISRR